MTSVAIMLLALTAPAAEPDAKETKKTPARVTITAELACLHCTYGEGDGCAVCLKIDDKTPVLLAGKTAKEFQADRLSNKVVVIEGTLGLNKDKRMVLTSDTGRLYTDKDKGKVPEKGLAQVTGSPCCAKCDLDLLKVCMMAVVNPTTPIVFDGKLAAKCAEEFADAKSVTVVGKLFIDKEGLVRLDVSKIDLPKK